MDSSAGKQLLLGLHRAGARLAKGGGKLLDGMTGGDVGFEEGIDDFTAGVGRAYAEAGALPENSTEAKEAKALDAATEASKGTAVKLKQAAVTTANKRPPAPPPPPEAWAESGEEREVPEHVGTASRPGSAKTEKSVGAERLEKLPEYAGRVVSPAQRKEE